MLQYLILVLYSMPKQIWILTDFGLSVEATSKRARTTLHSRGTASYRAPELLQKHATLTTRVDMWSMGCVFHELTSFTLAFQHNFAVLDYVDDRLVINPNKPMFIRGMS